MTDDLGFEAIDDELGRRLRNSAPAAGDPGLALDGLRPRLDQARRRRGLTVSVVSGAGVAAIAVLLVFVLIGGSGERDVRVPPATRPDVTTTTSTTTTTAPPALPPTTPTTDDNGGGNSGPGGGGSDDSGSGSGSSGSD